MAFTSDDLATRALGFLQLRQAGQSANPEDLQAVREFIEPLIEQLGIGGVVYVGDADDIDGAFFLPLAKRLAREIEGEFGTVAQNLPTIEDLEATIRALTAKKSSGFPVKMDYF